MAYRIFERTWWKDNACTMPSAGRKRYSQQVVQTETEAQRICRAENAQRPGYYRRERDEHGNLIRKLVPNRGPRGLATEYEEG